MALTNQQVISGLLEMFEDGTANPDAPFQVFTRESADMATYFEVDKLTYLVTDRKEHQSAIAETGNVVCTSA
jgi:hypothetical protein